MQKQNQRFALLPKKKGTVWIPRVTTELHILRDAFEPQHGTIIREVAKKGLPCMGKKRLSYKEEMDKITLNLLDRTPIRKTKQNTVVRRYDDIQPMTRNYLSRVGKTMESLLKK